MNFECFDMDEIGNCIYENVVKQPRNKLAVYYIALHIINKLVLLSPDITVPHLSEKNGMSTGGMILSVAQKKLK